MIRRKASEISKLELANIVEKIRELLYEAHFVLDRFKHKKLLADVQSAFEETDFDNDLGNLNLRRCEKCRGDGPCLWDGATGRYVCQDCHSEPNDPFFREHGGPRLKAVDALEEQVAELRQQISSEAPPEMKPPADPPDHVRKQCECDALIYGNGYALQGDDGEWRRVDPMRVRVSVAGRFTEHVNKNRDAFVAPQPCSVKTAGEIMGVCPDCGLPLDPGCTCINCGPHRPPKVVDADGKHYERPKFQRFNRFWEPGSERPCWIGGRITDEPPDDGGEVSVYGAPLPEGMTAQSPGHEVPAIGIVNLAAVRKFVDEHPITREGGVFMPRDVAEDLGYEVVECPHRDDQCDPTCDEWPDASCPDGPEE